MEKKKLIRKRFRAKDENGNPIAEISACSLVENPAIEKNFMLFSNSAGKKIVFKVTNEEKMEVTGPAMVPDMDILREDPETKEPYFCFFTQDDVEDYAELFLTKNYHQQANFEHGTYFSKDICVKESWICLDPETDKSKALGFKDVVAGTWFLTYKVSNPEVWKMIKQGSLQGFSVEITLEKFNEAEQDLESELEDIVDDLLVPQSFKRRAIKEITAFHSFVDVGELSFSDYPEQAVMNAQRALEWRSQNLNKNCGNKLMWTRATQIANKRPLSYSNLKRIALNVKLESKANASTYNDGCTAIVYDAFGGSDLIDWSLKRLGQIDTLIKGEVAKQVKPEPPIQRPFFN